MESLTPQLLEELRGRGLLNVDETCRFLGVSRDKLYGLLASGELESLRIGRARRILSWSVASYIEARLEAEHAA